MTIKAYNKGNKQAICCADNPSPRPRVFVARLRKSAPDFIIERVTILQEVDVPRSEWEPKP